MTGNLESTFALEVLDTLYHCQCDPELSRDQDCYILHDTNLCIITFAYHNKMAAQCINNTVLGGRTCSILFIKLYKKEVKGLLQP